MNQFDENKPEAAPAPTDSETLLRRIMGQLDLAPEPRAKRRGYHARLVFRCLLPRALAVLLALLAALLLVLAAAKPAAARDLAAETLENGFVRVTFRLERAPFVREVRAQLNGKPVFVAREDGVCSLLLNENGLLTLETVTLFGARADAELAVDTVDDQAPRLTGDSLEDGVLTIGLTDGGGSGIDWAGIRVYAAESREAYPLLEQDEGGSLIRMTLPDFALYIEIPDKAGNRLALHLEPDR